MLSLLDPLGHGLRSIVVNFTYSVLVVKALGYHFGKLIRMDPNLNTDIGNCSRGKQVVGRCLHALHALGVRCGE
jgi:hypothetical protein